MKEENKQKMIEVFMDEPHVSENLAETCANAAFEGGAEITDRNDEQAV